MDVMCLLLDEISACLKIDNQLVGQTPFKTCSQQCWDHRMSIDLDRARELEIAVYWKDYRYVSHVAWFGWVVSSPPSHPEHTVSLSRLCQM